MVQPVKGDGRGKRRPEGTSSPESLSVRRSAGPNRGDRGDSDRAMPSVRYIGRTHH